MISLGMVRDLLMQQERFEAVADVDKFLKEQEIPEDALIQMLTFDKKVFAEVSEAVEFAESKGFFTSGDMEEDDEEIRIVQLSPSEFERDSFKKIELRRGVVATIGKIRDMEKEAPLFLGDMRNPDEIKLSADLPHVIEIARVVEGVHPQFGQIIITSDTLKRFKKNFDDRVLGVDVSIDYDHEQREAAVWIRELFLSDDEQVLLGVVRWTPGGARTLSDREFRYFSPMYSLNWQHPHTGEFHGPTLTGGALVNSPFLKMDAIVGLSNKQKEVETMETIALSDHNAKVLKLSEEKNELQLSYNKLEKESKSTIDAQKDEIKTLSDKVDALEKEKAERERNEVHEKLFRENKINKAQLTALNEGKPMLDVLALGEKMNTEPQGGDGSNESDVILSAEEKEMCNTLGLSEEDYVKYNKKGA